MSRAWTSMMSSVFTFLRTSLARGRRTIATRSFSCPVRRASSCFMAYLLPPATSWKAFSTSQVHQIWLPTTAVMPRYWPIHFSLEGDLA